MEKLGPVIYTGTGINVYLCQTVGCDDYMTYPQGYLYENLMKSGWRRPEATGYRICPSCYKEAIRVNAHYS